MLQIGALTVQTAHDVLQIGALTVQTEPDVLIIGAACDRLLSKQERLGRIWAHAARGKE